MDRLKCVHTHTGENKNFFYAAFNHWSGEVIDLQMCIVLCLIILWRQSVSIKTVTGGGGGGGVLVHMWRPAKSVP